MSLTYKVVKLIFGFDDTKTEKYLAKFVTGETINFNMVRKQVCQLTGSHRAITNLIIDGLIDVAVNNLEMGHSIQLGEFGILRPGIRAKAQDSKDDVKASNIYRRKVNFIPGKMLKSFLRDVSITRMAGQEIDYTNSDSNGNGGNGNGGNNGGNDGGGGFIDPTE